MGLRGQRPDLHLIGCPSWHLIPGISPMVHPILVGVSGWTLKGGTSLWASRDARFGITYRLRSTRTSSNTIIYDGGNIGVIFLRVNQLQVKIQIATSQNCKKKTSGP